MSRILSVLDHDSSVAAAASALRWVGLCETSSPELEVLSDRAANRLQEHFELASRVDGHSLEQILSTDPVALVHAIALSGPNVRPSLVDSYIRFLRECKSLAFEPIRRDNCAVVQLMWECFLPEVALVQEISLLSLCDAPRVDDFNCNSVAKFALYHSRFGTRRVLIRHPLLQTVSRASLLMSVRRRNIAEAGLLLLSHSILFPDDDVDHVVQWFTRVRRSDGLFGSWELFGPTAGVANLSASVTVAWALVIRGQALTLRDDEIPVDAGNFDPVVPRFSHIQLHEVQLRVQHRVQEWLGYFIATHFQDQDEYGDKIKPLVELVLALWIQWRSATMSESREWAKAMAERLSALLDNEGLVEGIRLFTTSTLVAMMFPMLEEILNRQCGFREELWRIVTDPFSKGQERIPMRQMDYFFLRWLFGTDRVSDSASIQEELGRSLVAACANPAYFSNDSLYDITHVVFYATKFGTEPFEADPRSVEWCRKWVPELCLSMLLEQDYDLGGELLINWVQLSLPLDDAFWLALGLLISAVQSDGSVPGPVRLAKYESLTPFERDYHTTLICLIAFTIAAKNECAMSAAT